ncbi:P-loop containing nucleoside triphosphate hydrolase protein [Flagelloscypha sp. PMI_526]|nr:P-loop containing nucleoside triphosphate hydrolase protein [Flagelloscypha sp. PMI_526]
MSSSHRNATSGDWKANEKHANDHFSRSSISHDSVISKVSIAHSVQSVAPQPISPPPPSIKLLFAYLSTRHIFLFLVPAVLASLIAGGLAPFMTLLIGQVFNTFAQFPQSNPSPEDKRALLRGIGITCLELVGLGVGSFLLSSITSSLWIWTGEHNLRGLREHIYLAVSQKDMEWFDTRMDAEEGEERIGPAGLMSKFARETDDVRQATSLTSAKLVEHLTTCITCLVLAFMRSWALTLVILSAVPLLSFIQILSQILAGPLLASDRQQSAAAATLVDRAVSAISTVKAFNASVFEQKLLSGSLDKLQATTKKLNTVWAGSSGLSQFVMMAMFVQGFWFGSKLVRDGSIDAGDVMAVFWACLIATSHFQMCIPQLINLNKGKFAMVSLVTLAGESPATYKLSKQSRVLKKIVPRRCSGEFCIENVTFAYPSRPSVPVLLDVSIYLPANEMTFVVGSSGSGKSTLSQLLLHMYAPGEGVILLEDHPLHLLDKEWVRQHVASVSQDCILFDMSVHDNVAMGLVGSGRRPEDVSREDVINACRAALIHDFIRDLPDGYDTKLGPGGANLSGGQRQRLAIARAQLRDPTVLVLDEATSALDPTSRVLVFQAIKRWRAGKTTVVITHDLSQITSKDFIYVLKNGSLVEQGYRDDLENGGGEFRRMVDVQATTGGYLPEKDLDDSDVQPEFNLEVMDEEEPEIQEVDRNVSTPLPQFPFIDLNKPSAGARPGTWMLDAVQDLTRTYASRPSTRASMRSIRDGWELLDDGGDFVQEKSHQKRRPTSIQVHVPNLKQPETTAARRTLSRTLSLQFTPASPTSPNFVSGPDDQILFEKEFIESLPQRRRVAGPRIQWNQDQPIPLHALETRTPTPDSNSHPVPSAAPTLWSTLFSVIPTLPHKLVFFFGIFVCLCSGAITPLFSFLLSRLMFEVSIGVPNPSIINFFGGIVLSICAVDGILLGIKYFTMETIAMSWVTSARKQGFARVLAQDKEWFDKSENASVDIVQTLVKDGDDARNLVSTVVTQGLVSISMFSIGLVWALTQGWQLTLVGFAIAPVFAGTTAMQAKLVSKVELRNKEAREKVGKCYYETLANIRGIRSMSFDRVFEQQFRDATDHAFSVGSRGGKLEGISFGFSSGLIYLSEALLFFVGAILVSKGTYTYLQMVQTLNLLLFTVTIGSQLLEFTNRIPKAVHATHSLNRLLRLPVYNKESGGILRPANMSHLVFHDVHFAYPERPDVPVLQGINLDIGDECVAIVGASGSGKSTLAALLQRLYEPDQGMVSVGANDVRSIQVNYLRECIGVVSQNPQLFDASVRENIAYGNDSLSDQDIERAARAANVHDFVQSLPHGYETMVGENASLISGGQAQRIAIARALARTSSILILDECTSALDVDTQAAILETLQQAKIGRTTFMVTHKVPVMRMCDRILVMENGRIAEQGTFESLMRQEGIFASLAQSGEWSQ